VTEEEDFVRSILESNDDDDRLVYADWLQQRGDPRGELISVQCRLPSAIGEERRLLEVREAELLVAHERTWLGAWHGFADRWEMRRGFLEALTISEVAFVEHGTELLAANPLPLELLHLRALGLLWRGSDDRMSAVAAITAHTHLEQLRIDHSLGPEAARLLARSPAFTRLTALHLINTGIGDGAVGELVASEYLGRIETLELSTAHVTDGGVVALAASPRFSRLRALNLSSTDSYDPWANTIGNDGAIALVTSPHRRTLASLDLGESTAIGDELAMALAVAQLPDLVELGLRSTSITDAGAHALSRLPGLETVNVGHTWVGDAGALLLASMPRIRCLGLSDTRMTVDGIRRLIEVASPTLRVLELRFYENDLPDDLEAALRARFDVVQRDQSSRRVREVEP